MSFVILGTMVLVGVFDEKKVYRITMPLNWKGNTATLTMKFQSNGNTFATGETIHVYSVIFYPTNPNDPVSFAIVFPNSMHPSFQIGNIALTQLDGWEVANSASNSPDSNPSMPNSAPNPSTSECCICQYF